MTLLARRQQLGLTQDELADRSGVGQGTISALETGRASNPTLDTITKLEQALRCRLDFTTDCEVSK